MLKEKYGKWLIGSRVLFQNTYNLFFLKKKEIIEREKQ